MENKRISSDQHDDTLLRIEKYDLDKRLMKAFCEREPGYDFYHEYEKLRIPIRSALHDLHMLRLQKYRENGRRVIKKRNMHLLFDYSYDGKKFRTELMSVTCPAEHDNAYWILNEHEQTMKTEFVIMMNYAMLSILKNLEYVSINPKKAFKHTLEKYVKLALKELAKSRK